MEKLGWK